MSTNDDILLRIEFAEDDSINKISIDKNSTIENLKYEIQKKLNINYDEQVLINKGEFLQNNKLLKDYNITNNNRIILLIDEKENLMNHITSNKNTANYNISEQPNEMIEIEKKESNNNIINDSENVEKSKKQNIVEKLKEVMIDIFDKINIFKDKDDDKKKNTDNNFNNKNIKKFKYQQILIPDGAYNDQLIKLADMGFNDYEMNVQLIDEYNGNVEKCIEQLLKIYQKNK